MTFFHQKIDIKKSCLGYFLDRFFVDFLVCLKNLLFSVFGGSKVPVYTRKYNFGAIFDFPGVRKSTLGAPFSEKKGAFGGDGFRRGPSWSRPGRDLAPKTFKRRIFIDLGSFLVDFGRILDQFWDDFSMIFH